MTFRLIEEPDRVSSDERWRPIPGWEGYYEVSDQGRVRSVDRCLPHAHVGRQSVRGRVLKPAVRDTGHLVVTLRLPGHKRLCRVHRLVLTAFRGTCPIGMEGCHNNGDPADNRLSNLRWGTPSSNKYDSVRHGTHANAAKTHCKRGHEFTPENTITTITRNGGNGRRCRQCSSAHKRQYRDRSAKRAVAA